MYWLCINYVFLWIPCLRSVNLSIYILYHFFISHLFPVFFAKAARQLLQVEHYDAVVEERSLEGLCGHPPCSEAVLEVPERNLVMNFHTASRKLPDSWMMWNFFKRCVILRYVLFISFPLTESILFEDKPQEVIRAYAEGCIRQAVDEPEVLGWETSS